MLASGLIMVRPSMVSSFLSWRFTAAALACLTCTLMACSETSSQPLLVSLRIFPANPVVQEGKSTPLTATGIFSDSSRQDLTESVRWSSSAPRIVGISDEAGSRGLITGMAHGNATIRAVHEASGQSAEALAVVPFPPPILSSVQPAKGPPNGGTTITLIGKWFEPGILVTVGGAPVSNLRIVSETAATAQTPPGVTGPQDVVVQGTLGSATLPGGFTYRGAPTLTRVQPSSGLVYGGTVITLQGTDLTPDSMVTLGGTPLLNLTPIDDTSMTGTTPPGTVGSKDLVITNSLGSTTFPRGFTYEDSWRPANTGLDGGYVQQLVLHPSDPSILYAGTVRGGVFKSTNAGQSWTPSVQGLEDLTIQGLVIDPTLPATLYAATSQGLFKTTDGGRNWVSPSRTLALEWFTALVLDPAAPTTLYAATLGRGIFKTVDGGAAWNAVNTGLGSLNIRSLALDPSNAQVLYAGSVDGAIFKTTNGGQSWSPARAGVPDTAREIKAVVIDSNTPDTLYAAGNNGVYKSTDGGANWTSANTGLGTRFVLSLTLVAGTPTTLYAGTGDTLFKSTTGGASWSSVSMGLPPLPIRALLADSSNPSILYAGMQDAGVFKTTDGAASWAPSKAGLSNAEVFSITFSPTAPDTAYAGTRDGIFKTVDVGEHWSDVSQGLTSRQVYATAVHPTEPAIAYAGTFKGLYKTVNGGTSWVNLFSSSYSISAIALHPATPETIYLGTTQGLFKTVNGGSFWTALSQGIPSALWITSIAFSSQNPSTVFAAGLSRVYRSTDEGAQWVEVSAGLPASGGDQELWVVPGPVEALYLASANNGLFKTVNGGESWEQLFSSNAYSLVIHPQDPQTMYVGPVSNTEPVQLSRDGGRTWVPASLPFFTAVGVLAMKPGDPQTILAGTWGRGIYKTTIGGR
jgi:photosystem II stability/assembly factor-like uncharacterized protein